MGKHAKQDELLLELAFNFEETHMKKNLCCCIKKFLFSNFLYLFSGELKVLTVKVSCINN